MALGTPLFAGLVRANCTVTIQVATAAPTGGTQVTWSTLKSGVPVLVSEVQSERAYVNGVMMELVRCSVAGKEPYLQRPDVRFLVTAASKGLAGLVGRYLSATNPGTGHSRGVGGILKERVNVRCESLMVPADAGSSL